MAKLITRRALLRSAVAGTAGAACRRSFAKRATVSAAPPPLTAGVNLSMWFQFAQKAVPSDPQLEGLRRLGVDHVRLPVDPQAIGWQPDAATGQPPFTSLGGLDRAVERLVAQHLFVNLDLHPGPQAIDRLKRSG